MTFFDDNVSNPPDQSSDPQLSASQSSEPQLSEITPPLPGDPLSYTISRPLLYSERPEVPEDLRISWSWVHLLCFIVFALGVFAILPFLMAIPYLQGKHIRPQELENYLYSIPQFVVGSTLASFAAILFFLYITLAKINGKPFWHTLGWRKLSVVISKLPGNPWAYFFSGCALSLITSIVGSRVHTPDDMPIELLMKSKVGATLMMAMAVLVAPLVEETVFRGYLYPVLVRIVSAVVRFIAADSARATRISVLASIAIVATLFRVFHKGRLAWTWGILSLLIFVSIILIVVRFIGTDYARAIRAGIFSSVVLTGGLFGVLHGAQLAWTWGIVSLLILVGIIFTYVRARTGTVFASYLMHLGYNSLIAFVSILATHGFTKMPPHP